MSEINGENGRKSSLNNRKWIYLIFKKLIWPKMGKFNKKNKIKLKNIMYTLHNILIRKKNIWRVNKRKQEKKRAKDMKTVLNKL